MSDIRLCLGMQYLKTPERAKATHDLAGSAPESVPVFIHGSDEKEPIMVWGLRLWRETLRLATETGCTHCLFLQEDSVLCPDFWEVLPQMVAAKPDQIISLHTPHWRFEGLYVDGADWVTTVDGLIGNAYVLPVETMRELLDFIEEDVKPAAVAYHSEDGMIATFAMSLRRKIFHPMPSPVDHGVIGPSCYGHGEEAYYRPQVRWNLGGVSWPKTWKTPAVHLGMVYRGEHWRLRSYLKPEAVVKYDVVRYMYQLENTEKNPRYPRADY